MSERLKALPQFEITPPQPDRDFDDKLQKELTGISRANFPPNSIIEITFRPDTRKRAPIYDPQEKVRTLLATARALTEAGYQVYPHLAARMLDYQTAKQAVTGFSDLGINKYFLIAGDADPTYSNDLPDSISLAKEVLQTNPEIQQLGFAAYPNLRHPLIPPDRLAAAQEAKAKLAKNHPNLKVSFQTQFTFSSSEINDLASQLPDGSSLVFGILPPLTIKQLLKTIEFSGYSKTDLFKQKPILALTLALNLFLQKLPFEVPLPQRLNLKPDGLIMGLNNLPRLDPKIEGAFIYTMGDYQASAKLYRRLSA